MSCNTPTSQPDLLWSPPDPSSTTTSKFCHFTNTRHSISPPLATYEDLHRWSCSNRSDFWSDLWDFENILGTKGSFNDNDQVDENARPSDNPLWFPGASVNWAENQLRNHLSHPDDIAIISTSEPCLSLNWKPTIQRLTQSELYNLVGKAQRGLKSAGIVKGDRIAWWGGNVLESVILLLATSSIGAIFSSAAADFGVDGVLERLEQIKPKLLFVTNAVVYAGTPRPLINLLPTLLDKLSQPPNRVIVVDHLPDTLLPTSSSSSSLKTPLTKWEDFINTGINTGEGETTFVRMGFNDPIWILFSSGTTGKPKAIVHRQGGMLLDSLREHHLAGDMGRGDVYLYYTTPGWMMYQYLVSGLSTGATIVLYEGSPLKPPSYLFSLIDKLGITIFGTSAKWIEQISKHYPNVKENHDLGTLKQILSTGSPLPGHLFDFVYEKIKKDVLLGSVTGGTDICSVFAGRNTSLPVYRGEIQSRMLGFALATDTGENQPGELVCTEAFPIEPLGFWPLPGYGFPEVEVVKAQERFKESYFKDDQGTWYHGDYVQFTPSRSGNAGGLLMLGRSDGVLNPGGIRFGPTDIYSVLENDKNLSDAGIEEGLVVGLMVEDMSDEKVILFIKMKEGIKLDEESKKKIGNAIRLARSARHVPSKIIQVNDIPVTLTGKRVEVPIRKVINGADISTINPATLRNPECLEEYALIGEQLRRDEGTK